MSTRLGGRYFPSLLLGGAHTAAHTAGDRTNDLRHGVRALNWLTDRAGYGTPLGGLADSTHVFRPCVPRFESRRWQKGCDRAPRRRQRFLHVNINVLNEDMDVSRPLTTTLENNCTGVGPGSSERYILVIRIE
ncbi:unnamed protein product [Albugo candida]|uniref:Uncharacterized protein n=1 Tax=Albugo candida TaxID=65357 RepID=A0A024FVT4_9STRA|nr:unnamed protein product [Albugo candida]|eukprot:CCI10982.1 unnamed protein product [Albugo candida]